MEKIPWDTITPQLVALRATGATWMALADAVNSKYDAAITSQAVRYWVTREKVFNTDGGYILPTSRGVKGARYTHEQGIRALQHASRVLGRELTHETISISEYNTFKANLAEEEKNTVPSAVAIRRMFGSWNDALIAADITPGNRWRNDYDGLTREDIVIHVAHFLRWMRTSLTGQEATSARYQQWATSNPSLGAASWELVRWHGTWTDIATEGALIEHSMDTLPNMKPVQPGGAKKMSKKVSLD